MILEDNPTSISKIAQKLKMTIQGIQRHIHRLLDSGLIEKNFDGKLSLTNLGQISLMQIPGLNFLSKQQQYFLAHDFSDIPSEFISRIGDLEKSITSFSMASTTNNSQKIIKKAKKYVRCIFTQPPILVGELIKKQLESDIKVSLIFGKNSIIPENSKMVSLLGLKTKTIQKNLEKRLADNVRLNLIFNEKSCQIFFSSKDGMTDLCNSFESNDPFFHKWCSDFFDSKWKCAEPFGRLR